MYIALTARAANQAVDLMTEENFDAKSTGGSAAHGRGGGRGRWGGSGLPSRPPQEKPR